MANDPGRRNPPGPSVDLLSYGGRGKSPDISRTTKPRLFQATATQCTSTAPASAGPTPPRRHNKDVCPPPARQTPRLYLERTFFATGGVRQRRMNGNRRAGLKERRPFLEPANWARAWRRIKDTLTTLYKPTRFPPRRSNQNHRHQACTRPEHHPTPLCQRTLQTAASRPR